MKFLNFMEKPVEPFLHIKLTDLAKTLARSSELELDFAFHSYFKKEENIVTVSHYWNDIIDAKREDGMISDVYLRAYGNVHFTDFNVVTDFLTEISSSTPLSFLKQLFSLIEDIRIEQKALKDRPGMIYAFEARHSFFQKRFRERFTIHSSKQESLDALFCAFYLQLTKKPVALPEPISKFKPFMRHLQSEITHFLSTNDVRSWVLSFSDQLDDFLQDMKSSYLTMYVANGFNHPSVILEEDDELKSSSPKKVEDKGEKETYEEEMPSWHEEQEQDGNNFLQFDLDQGTKTDLLGEGDRKAESGDQAFASVQGSAQESDGKSFEQGSESAKKDEFHVKGSKPSYGEANRLAKELTIAARKPTFDEQQTYHSFSAKVQPIQKSLQRSIQKTIEQKKIAPRNDLHYGRLSRKLLRAVTDENPRLFYKKDSPSTKLDVTFTLLVDCSASMHDKIVQTKEGIVLFHETLRSLSIPHSIVGFWEDAFEADDKEQPNYLFEIIRNEHSLLPNQGAHIMQLQPEEDNRDGFAIRKVAEELYRRPEKHKILLVFTDGEPSAFDYQDNGVVDTHEAVLDTRKRGIEVIGVFLSNGEPQEKEKDTMKNIYGRQSLVIPTVEEIPTYITPLLKKLLFRFF